MLKVIAISGDKVYYRIGVDLKNSLWYKTDKVKDIEVLKGDIIEIEFEKDASGVNILNSIKMVERPVTPVPSSSTSTGTQKEWRSKSPQESEQIRRQSIGYMVSETIKVFDKYPSTKEGIDWLSYTIKELYKTYDEITK